MELDDLKLAWQTIDRRLEQSNALNLQLFKERKLEKARSGLRPLVLGQTIQLAAGILLMMVSAPFWIRHLGTLHLVVPGLLLHAYALLLVVLAARDLHMIGRIDYAAPVLDIQRQLAELRAWRIRIGPVFAVTGCFVWIPLMLVIFKWLGADVWVKSPEVVYSFIASGFACLGIVYGIARWLRRPGREEIARRFDDDAAGRSVNRAQAVLDEIARFEKM